VSVTLFFFVQEYIKYFTNIENVRLLPNLCGYITDRYKLVPTASTEILIAPARGVNGIIADELVKAIQTARITSSVNQLRVDQRMEANTKPKPVIVGGGTSLHQNLAGSVSRYLSRQTLKLAHIRDLYAHFEYSDLVRHPAIIVLPYQVHK
jgi:hypothetical protein